MVLHEASDVVAGVAQNLAFVAAAMAFSPAVQGLKLENVVDPFKRGGLRRSGGPIVVEQPARDFEEAQPAVKAIGEPAQRKATSPFEKQSHIYSAGPTQLTESMIAMPPPPPPV